VADGSDLRVRGATWGQNWIIASISNRSRFWKNHEFSQRAGILRRPDWIFHGLGPDTSGERTRYSETRVDAALEYAAQLWRTSSATASVGIRDAKFDGGTGCCSDPTLDQAVADGRFAEPPGLDEGYTVLRSGFSLALDARRRRNLDHPREGSDYVSPPGGGVRLAVRGEHAGGLTTTRATPGADLTRYNWVKYGATLGGFVDVDGQQRILGLSVIADFADPLRSDGQIPFTEQVGVGGERPMRGFLEGRLLDRSAIVAQAEYRWPVWVWLDGTFHYAVGNVFGAHLDDFELDQLRQSFGIGLRANNARDHAFEILTAFGSETFDQGGGIDTFRFVFGASSGF
jgi:hypothetical protein